MKQKGGKSLSVVKTDIVTRCIVLLIWNAQSALVEMFCGILTSRKIPNKIYPLKAMLAIDKLNSSLYTYLV